MPFFIIAAVILFCAALVLGIVVLLVGLGLVMLGIISFAVIVGILRRSVIRGLETFFMLISITVGTSFGIALAALAHWTAFFPGTLNQWIIAGATLGLLVSLLVGVIFNFVWVRAVRWVASQFDPQSQTVPISEPSANTGEIK